MTPLLTFQSQAQIIKRVYVDKGVYTALDFEGKGHEEARATDYVTEWIFVKKAGW